MLQLLRRGAWGRRRVNIATFSNDKIRLDVCLTDSFEKIIFEILLGARENNGPPQNKIGRRK